jgi:hypothetical protein
MNFFQCIATKSMLGHIEKEGAESCAGACSGSGMQSQERDDRHRGGEHCGGRLGNGEGETRAFYNTLPVPLQHTKSSVGNLALTQFMILTATEGDSWSGWAGIVNLRNVLSVRMSFLVRVW